MVSCVLWPQGLPVSVPPPPSLWLARYLSYPILSCPPLSPGAHDYSIRAIAPGCDPHAASVMSLQSPHGQTKLPDRLGFCYCLQLLLAK